MVMRCCDLTSGKMRTKASLQKRAKTSDGGGGFSSTWDTYATVRAHVKPLSGFERLHAERLDAVTRLRAYIRYRKDIEPKHRMVIDGVAYQIRAVLDLELRKQWLELDLEQGVAT